MRRKENAGEWRKKEGEYILESGEGRNENNGVWIKRKEHTDEWSKKEGRKILKNWRIKKGEYWKSGEGRKEKTGDLREKEGKYLKSGEGRKENWGEWRRKEEEYW